jgi:signal transduction histidine kinase
LGDVVMAAVMTGYGLYDVLANHAWPGRPVVDALLVTVMTTSLAFRRVVPMVVMVVVGTSLTVAGVLYGSAQAWSTMFPFIVAVYSVAAYHSSIGAALLVVLATMLLRDHFDPSVDTVSDFTFTLTALSVLAGLEGRRVRRRHVVLDDRADALLREEEAIAAAAAAAERENIARELHDIISHGLGLIVLQAGAAEQVLGTDPAAAREVLTSIRSTGQEAVGELGAMLGAMRHSPESVREPQPTLDDIGRLVERSRRAGADVQLSLDIATASPSPALQVSAFRVVQEALTNSFKYAPGAHVEVVVASTERQLEARVIDNGTASGTAVGNRRGLAGLAERVSVFGGTFHAGPRRDGGWEVLATFPMRR